MYSRLILFVILMFMYVAPLLQGQEPPGDKAVLAADEHGLDFEWFVTMHNLLAKIATKGVLDPDPAASQTMELHAIRQSLSNFLATTWDDGRIVAGRKHRIKQLPWPTSEFKPLDAVKPVDTPALKTLEALVRQFDRYGGLQLNSFLEIKKQIKVLNEHMLLEPSQIPAYSKGDYPLSKLDAESPVRVAIKNWSTMESLVSERLGTIEPKSGTTLVYATELSKLIDELFAASKAMTAGDSSFKTSPMKLEFLRLLRAQTESLCQALQERDAFPAQVQAWRTKCDKTLTEVANALAVMWNPATPPEVFAKTSEGVMAHRRELADQVALARKILHCVQVQQQKELFYVDQIRQLIKRNRNAWFDDLRAEASVFAVAQLAKYDAKFAIVEVPATETDKQFVNLGSDNPSQVEPHLASILTIPNRVDTSLNSTTAEFNTTTNRIESTLISFESLSKQLSEAIASKALDPAKPSLMVVRGLKLKMQGDYTFAVPALNMLIVCETLELDNVRCMVAPGCTATILCHRIVASSKSWTHLSCNNTGRMVVFSSTVPDSWPLQLAGDPKSIVFETDGPFKKPWHALQKSAQASVSQFVTNYWADMTEHLISWYLDSPVFTENVAKVAAEVLNLPRTVAIPSESSRRADELRQQATTRVYKDRVVQFYLPDEKVVISALIRFQNGQLIAEILPTELAVQRTAEGKLGSMSLLDSSALSVRMLVHPMVSEKVAQVARRKLDERIPGIVVMDTDWRSLALRWLPLSLEGTEVKTDRPIAWDHSQQKTTVEFVLADNRAALEFHSKLKGTLLFDCEVIAPDTRTAFGRMRLPLKFMENTEATDTGLDAPALSELFSMGGAGNQKVSITLLNVDQVRFGGNDGSIGSGPLVDLQKSSIEMRFGDSKNRYFPPSRRSFDELNGTFRLDVPALQDHTLDLRVQWISRDGGASFTKDFSLPYRRADGTLVERLEITKPEMEEWLSKPLKVASRD